MTICSLAISLLIHRDIIQQSDQLENVLPQNGQTIPHFSDVIEDTQEPGIGSSQRGTLQALFQKQSENKLITSGAKKDAFDRAGVINCIHNNASFRMTTSPSYKSLMMMVSGGTYNGACYATNMKHLGILAEEGRNEAKQKMDLIINKVESSRSRVLTFQGGTYTGAQVRVEVKSPLSIDLDAWSEPSTGTSLLAVNGHYIDDSWEHHGFLLGCTNVSKDSHTGELLQKKVTGLLQDYGAPVDTTGECEIVMVKVADNASNNKKAFKNEKLLGCVCHTYELSTHHFTAQKQVSALLQKASKVVTHFHMSTKAMQELKKLGKAKNLQVNKFVQDVSTRFFSTQASLVSMLNNQYVLLEYDKGVSEGKYSETDAYKEIMLTKGEWTMIEECVACLQRVGDITKLLEGDDITVSQVLPSLFIVIKSFESNVIYVRVPSPSTTVGFESKSIMVKDFSPAIMEARQNFIQDFKKRWIENLPEESLKIYLISSKLDPRSKKCQFLDATVLPYSWQHTLNDAILTALRSRTVEDEDEDDGSSVDGGGDLNSGGDDTEKTEDAIGGCLPFNIMSMVQEMSGFEARTQEQQQSTQERPDPPSIEDEYKAYDLVPQIKSSEDPLKWWKEHEQFFPRIASMAREYLAVPASSASVERFFSSVGLVKADNRPLKDETTIDIMWAKNVRE